MRSGFKAAWAAALFCISIVTVASSPAPVTTLGPTFAPLTNLADMDIGQSVALSQDGTVAAVAVGGAGSNPPTATHVGQIFIYTSNGGAWQQSGQLADPGAQNNSSFGAAVALSADGKSILVGAPGDDKAYLFTQSSGNWTYSQTFADPYVSTGYGTAVALSQDGTVAVIGDHNHDVGAVSNVGAVFVYRLSGVTWSTDTEVDVPVYTPATYDFGYSVALSADDSRLLVGAPETDGSGPGYVYLFTASGSAWTPAQSFFDPGHAMYDVFGVSVALSGDGNTILGSSLGPHLAGTVYLFKDNGASWGSPQVFANPDGQSGESFGSSLSVSGDGGTWAASAPGATVNGQAGAGKAFLYRLSGGTWQTPQEYEDPGSAAGDGYGTLALSADTTTVLVGAEGTGSGGYSNVGAAYLYNPGVELGLSATVFSASAVPGGSITYNVEVDDKSAAIFTGALSVTATLPAGLSYAGSDPAGCSTSGSTMTCSLNALAPGRKTAINITAQIASTASGTLKTDFSVQSSGQYAVGTSPTTASISTQVTGSGAGSGNSGGGGGGGALGWLSVLGLVGINLFKRRRR